MYDPIPYNEPELLRQVGEGDESAYRILYDRYWDRIYSTAFAFTKSEELSRDLAQEVFAMIWVRREKLLQIEKFEAYLFTMARNAARNSLRTKAYTRANTMFYEIYFSESAGHPKTSLDLKELTETIEEGINRLSPQQQKAFRLSRFKGLSIKEIAREMNLTEATAKSHLVRGIAAMRRFLDERPSSLSIALWILLFLS